MLSAGKFGLDHRTSPLLELTDSKLFWFVSLPTSSYDDCNCLSMLLFLSLFYSTLSSQRCPRGLNFTCWGCSGLCHRHKPTELAHSFLFCSCVYFCLYCPFHCISFHKFSRQFFAFSLCSSGRNSAFLVLSFV